MPAKLSTVTALSHEVSLKTNGTSFVELFLLEEANKLLHKQMTGVSLLLSTRPKQRTKKFQSVNQYIFFIKLGKKNIEIETFCVIWPRKELSRNSSSDQMQKLPHTTFNIQLKCKTKSGIRTIKQLKPKRDVFKKKRLGRQLQ